MKTWLKNEHIQSNLQVKRIPFRDSQEWHWNSAGFLAHHTNRFFNVVGVRFYSILKGGYRTQPIIDQSEIGLLSYLVYKDTDGWWILAHAKVEPGNVNGAQLAPTVQATKSNYEMVHGGTDTPYLDLVRSAPKPLCDQLQSEQNSRFVAKRNRNSVVLVNKRVNGQGSQFKWIPISRLLSQLAEDYAVNTDARSVLTCWLFTDIYALRECLDGSGRFANILTASIESEDTLHADKALKDWMESLNAKWQTNTEIISLKELDANWTCNDSEIVSGNDPFLMIYQIAVSCNKREVHQWDQPISGSLTKSEIILFIGSYEGALHLLLQAKLEAGNRNGFELTTTVQAEPLTASKLEIKYIETAVKNGKTLLDFHNSEEGGRFDRCVSRYQIVWVDEVTEALESPFHRWVSLSQFSAYLQKENILTNELRSAASSLLCVKDL
jgi:oxidase EvaA